MIAVDYRADRQGFSFYVSLSAKDDRLVTALKAIVSIDLSKMARSGTYGGWAWDGRASIWIVRRWAWSEFMDALRVAYPDDIPVMTPRAESAAIEEFTDRTLASEAAQMAWVVFGLRSDAHWNIVVVAARAVVWAHLESVRTGKNELQLTPYTPRDIVIAFTKLHKTYGEPMIPGDIIDLLRRLAGTVEDDRKVSRSSRQTVDLFASWEQRMTAKIIRKGKA